MIDLLAWIIKLKLNNTSQISPFVSSLFAKAIAESNVPLEWIKNKDMLTMLKMMKESDEEQIQDTSKDHGKQKRNQYHGDREE